MKCKRCGTDMRREKAGTHNYRYVCPKCNLTISGKRKDTQTETGGNVETHNSDE